VKYVNAIDGSGGNGLEKLRLKPEEAKAAGDAILARMMAEGASQTDGGTPMGQADPNQFDAGAPEAGQDDELPF
jgi:phage FluMu gp28-like protein